MVETGVKHHQASKHQTGVGVPWVLCLLHTISGVHIYNVVE